MKNTLLNIFMLSIALFLPLQKIKADEKEKIISKIEFDKQQINLYQLSNGMKVAFKYSDNNEDVLIRLIATGGFSVLKTNQRASGQLAAKIALKSGIGPFSYDSFQTMLYRHSIDFNSSVQPFCRFIEGSCDKEEFETLLNIINLYFTDSHFTKESFQNVVKREQEKAIARSNDPNKLFDNSFFELNTKNSPHFHCLTQTDLNKIDFKDSNDFFKSAFSDPADFVCVIVGNVNIETLEKNIIKNIASIPGAEKSAKITFQGESNTSPGIKTKTIRTCNHVDAKTCITFPIKIDLTEKTAHSVEVIVKLMQQKLKQKVPQFVELNVAYELPYYPTLKYPWVTIQYFTDKGHVWPVGQLILKEVNRMQKEGFSDDEIKSFIASEKKESGFLQKSNNAWLTSITHYLIWDWNLNKLTAENLPQKTDGKKINRVFKNLISLDQYTLITTSQ